MLFISNASFKKKLFYFISSYPTTLAFLSEFSQDTYLLSYIITKPSKWVSQGLAFVYSSGASACAGASAENQRTFFFLKKAHI